MSVFYELFNWFQRHSKAAQLIELNTMNDIGRVGSVVGPVPCARKIAGSKLVTTLAAS